MLLSAVSPSNPNKSALLKTLKKFSGEEKKILSENDVFSLYNALGAPHGFAGTSPSYEVYSRRDQNCCAGPVTIAVCSQGILISQNVFHAPWLRWDLWRIAFHEI